MDSKPTEPKTTTTTEPTTTTEKAAEEMPVAAPMIDESFGMKKKMGPARSLKAAATKAPANKGPSASPARATGATASRATAARGAAARGTSRGVAPRGVAARGVSRGAAPRAPVPAGNNYNQDFIKQLKSPAIDLRKTGADIETDPTIELSLLLDCTSSMCSWIEKAKKTLHEIIDKTIKECEEDGKLKCRVSFVGYRDIKD